MEDRSLAVTQMEDPYADGGKDIGDQAPVTTPPEEFSAHNGGSETAGEHD